jgi:hypothetical protein
MKKISPVVSALFSVWLLAAPLALAEGGNGKIEQEISALSDAMIQANLKGDTIAHHQRRQQDPEPQPCHRLRRTVLLVSAQCRADDDNRDDNRSIRPLAHRQ